ncbi:MAG: NAD(P) transhydrogenase subunit alpha [Myxococcota bacterium]
MMDPVAATHFVMQLYVLVLSALIGLEVIAKVPVLLHTPLMSGSNAISGIVLVGAITLGCGAESSLARLLANGAVFLATVNVVGGFVVTDRMLSMFRKQTPKARDGQKGSEGKT